VRFRIGGFGFLGGECAARGGEEVADSKIVLALLGAALHENLYLSIKVAF